MKIILPLKQHVGVPTKPIVEIGNEVYRGDLISIPEGLGVNIHSSVSGKVLDVNDNNIVIEAYKEQPKDYTRLKKNNDYLETIKDAGIVGSGGAGFPTFVKLKANLIENGAVILNAAECEPILKHNMKRIEKDPELLIRGLKYIMEITKAPKGYIAIKPKNTKALIALGKAIEKERNIEIKYLPDMYPAGDERAVLRELFGITLEPGQLPLEANCVVSNVETVKNIALAIEERRPVITKDVTVGGRINSETKVFLDIPIGVSVKSVLKKCGDYVEPYGEIIFGGPFTGKPGNETSPITKTTGGLLVSMPFPQDNRKFGVLGCECGAQIDRLTEIVEAMEGEVVSSTNCKRMKEINGRYRCNEPGVCPGQAEKVIKLKNEGANVIVVGTCET